jgi:transcriptional regulator with XRE-family HTH domain
LGYFGYKQWWLAVGLGSLSASMTDPTITAQELGRRLAAVRAHRGLEQPDVAALARKAGIRGVAKTSLSRIENGAVTPRHDVLAWLCDIYAIAPADLTNPEAEIFGSNESRLTKSVERLTDAVGELLTKID